MTDRELMQQALEALELAYAGIDAITVHGKAITALRERLAQPEQKPVAWGVFDGPNLHDVNFTEEEAQEMMRLKGDGSVVKPLYTSPQAQRKPLTDEEIVEGRRAPWGFNLDPFTAGVRFAESAHGIKEKNT